MYPDISIEKLPIERYIQSTQSIQFQNSALSPKFKRQEISQIYISQLKLSQLLNEAKKRANIPNWDDEDGLPADEKCFHFMQTFISVYPSGLPLPDIYPDPDGTIGMEWEFVDGTSLVANMMPSGEIAYSVYGTKEKTYGAIRWDQLKFPQQLLNILLTYE